MRTYISAFLIAALALAAPCAGGCSSSDHSGVQATPAVIHSLHAERDDSGIYTLTWDPVAPDAVVEVTGGTSPDGIDHQKVLARITGGASVTVRDLDATKRWYFEVGSPGAAGVLVGERHLHLLGAANYRDLGGYLTSDGHALRWGLVYRSDALAKLQPSDVDFLGGIGLKLVVDLRTDNEVSVAPDTLADGSRIAYTRQAIILPLDPKQILSSGTVIDIAFMTDVYKQLVDENAAIFAKVFSDLAEAAARPVAVHCTAGKDRTGIASALLLSALGVPDDVIGQDYQLTDTYTAAIAKAQEDQLRAQGIDPAKLGILLKSPPEVIVATIAHVREKYGSIDSYLQSGGLDGAALTKLRAALLSPLPVP